MTGPAELLGTALPFLDWAGVAVFACSGALVAAAKKQTLVTLIFFAVVTGVGGGTARDLLIGAPVFWVHENAILLICFAGALAVWTLPGTLWQGGALPWLDAVGIAAYATYGAAKGLAFGLAPIPAVAMGVLTACLGGIIRDVLAGEPSILMRPELYVTAAALSAALMVGLLLAGAPAAIAGIVAACAGFALRAGAIHFGWKLPAYGRNGGAPFRGKPESLNTAAPKSRGPVLWMPDADGRRGGGGMKRMILALLLGLAVAPPLLAATKERAPDGTHILVNEAVVDAPPEQVWAAISTAEGWKRWAAPVAWAPSSDLIETSYTPTARAGDPSTIRQQVLLRVPRRLMVFRTVKAPERFPDFDTYAKVVSVFELEPAGEGRTRVRLTGVGYPDTEAGRRLLAFFERGNQVSLDALKAHFAKRGASRRR
jgi:uncharacterized membrane protein YeiH/uncharacterized protein YndB with AHSA1/START domain